MPSPSLLAAEAEAPFDRPFSKPDPELADASEETASEPADEEAFVLLITKRQLPVIHGIISQSTVGPAEAKIIQGEFQIELEKLGNSVLQSET